MELSEIFDPMDLMNALTDGYVRVQRHPSLNCEILNYTEKAVFDRHWTPVTLNCRGLIVKGMSVIARPFPKFFNYSELVNQGVTLPLDQPVRVMDKLDGSLGIMYVSPTGYSIATRGSFDSPQARHATEIWNERYNDKYAADFDGIPNSTALFEIIYRENRIVCDYGDMDDLVLLGGVKNKTGEIVGPEFFSFWEGPRAETFSYATLAEALAAEPREGAEGFVIHLSGTMVKLKQEDYVILHKLVTGLNERTVWEAWSEGQTVEQICAPLPDEFHGWVREVYEDLDNKAAIMTRTVEKLYELIIKLMASDFGLSREELEIIGKGSDPKVFNKHYALQVMMMAADDSLLKGLLFLRRDGRDLMTKIRESLKPEAGLTPHNTLSQQP